MQQSVLIVHFNKIWIQMYEEIVCVSRWTEPSWSVCDMLWNCAHTECGATETDRKTTVTLSCNSQYFSLYVIFRTTMTTTTAKYS